MFAGIMMTAMNETLHVKYGLQGWQWVFVIGKCPIPTRSPNWTDICRRSNEYPVRYLRHGPTVLPWF
jgi:hypothetical protein